MIPAPGPKEEKLKLSAILFIAGLILAGSDGPWFPYVNYAGAIIFSLFPVAAWRAQRIEEKRMIQETMGRR